MTKQKHIERGALFILVVNKLFYVIIQISSCVKKGNPFFLRCATNIPIWCVAQKRVNKPDDDLQTPRKGVGRL